MDRMAYYIRLGLTREYQQGPVATYLLYPYYALLISTTSGKNSSHLCMPDKDARD